MRTVSLSVCPARTRAPRRPACWLHPGSADFTASTISRHQIAQSWPAQRLPGRLLLDCKLDLGADQPGADSKERCSAGSRAVQVRRVCRPLYLQVFARTSRKPADTVLAELPAWFDRASQKDCPRCALGPERSSYNDVIRVHSCCFMLLMGWARGGWDEPELSSVLDGEESLHNALLKP